ncbi:T9SS type A sorting domain-containing protein [Aquimarina spongiae]|uniref:Por secretion system C-terminal sorting domain-containing protein n=1 Tax=Aquimarina spongiae TaxID=570521 RepID=A0A1M6F6E2_9FLAO|nr:T9SS type A sorting domain-containing protein [Aquimarina spongiae]SHI93222.1 Por secretion system C-terminal sorting domain-containing protein [Aquimarina spongiae]
MKKLIVLFFVISQLHAQEPDQLAKNKIVANGANTNLGYNAGNSGFGNTSIGYEAGNVVTANANTFLGFEAGARNTIGYDNVFLGLQSGAFTTSGRQNVFIGRASGVNNANGAQNVFIGHRSGSGSNAFFNVFIGNESGRENYDGNENVFLGNRSGSMNFRGNLNTFIGNAAGEQNRFGEENTFLGAASGVDNQANYNTFLGAYTGLANQSGERNTFIGYRTGSFNTTGSYNVFLGSGAGNGILTGSHNVMIGNVATWTGDVSNKLVIQDGDVNRTPLIYGDFSTGNVSINSTSNFGYRLYVNGDAYTTGVWVSNQGGSVFRTKNNVSSLKDPIGKLQMINSIEQTITVERDNQKARQEKQYILDANELRNVFPALVKNNKEHTAINYQGLIPVLIEAVKELKKENEKLKEQLSAIVHLTTGNTSNRNEDQSFFSKGFALSQNIPNPFTTSSIISYTIPKGYEQRASIKIFDLNGRQIKVYEKLKSGGNTLKIQYSSIPSGTYVYAMCFNDQIVTFKRMIIN